MNIGLNYLYHLSLAPSRPTARKPDIMKSIPPIDPRLLPRPAGGPLLNRPLKPFERSQPRFYNQQSPEMPPNRPRFDHFQPMGPEPRARNMSPYSAEQIFPFTSTSVSQQVPPKPNEQQPGQRPHDLQQPAWFPRSVEQSMVRPPDQPPQKPIQPTSHTPSQPLQQFPTEPRFTVPNSNAMRSYPGNQFISKQQVVQHPGMIPSPRPNVSPITFPRGQIPARFPNNQNNNPKHVLRPMHPIQHAPLPQRPMNPQHNLPASPQHGPSSILLPQKPDMQASQNQNLAMSRNLLPNQIPQNSNIQPHNQNVQPQNQNVHPRNELGQPLSQNVQPQNQNVPPHNQNLPPHNQNLLPHGQNVLPFNHTVQPQRQPLQQPRVQYHNQPPQQQQPQQQPSQHQIPPSQRFPSQYRMQNQQIPRFPNLNQLPVNQLGQSRTQVSMTRPHIQKYDVRNQNPFSAPNIQPMNEHVFNNGNVLPIPLLPEKVSENNELLSDDLKHILPRNAVETRMSEAANSNQVIHAGQPPPHVNQGICQPNSHVPNLFTQQHPLLPASFQPRNHMDALPQDINMKYESSKANDLIVPRRGFDQPNISSVQHVRPTLQQNIPLNTQSIPSNTQIPSLNPYYQLPVQRPLHGVTEQWQGLPPTAAPPSVVPPTTPITPITTVVQRNIPANQTYAYQVSVPPSFGPVSVPSPYHGPSVPQAVVTVQPGVLFTAKTLMSHSHDPVISHILGKSDTPQSPHSPIPEISQLGYQQFQLQQSLLQQQQFIAMLQTQQNQQHNQEGNKIETLQSQILGVQTVIENVLKEQKDQEDLKHDIAMKEQQRVIEEQHQIILNMMKQKEEPSNNESGDKKSDEPVVSKEATLSNLQPVISNPNSLVLKEISDLHSPSAPSLATVLAEDFKCSTSVSHVKTNAEFLPDYPSITTQVSKLETVNMVVSEDSITNTGNPQSVLPSTGTTKSSYAQVSAMSNTSEIKSNTSSAPVTNTCNITSIVPAPSAPEQTSMILPPTSAPVIDCDELVNIGPSELHMEVINDRIPKQQFYEPKVDNECDKQKEDIDLVLPRGMDEPMDLEKGSGKKPSLSRLESEEEIIRPREANLSDTDTILKANLNDTDTILKYSQCITEDVSKTDIVPEKVDSSIIRVTAKKETEEDENKADIATYFKSIADDEECKSVASVYSSKNIDSKISAIPRTDPTSLETTPKHTPKSSPLLAQKNLTPRSSPVLKKRNLRNSPILNGSGQVVQLDDIDYRERKLSDLIDHRHLARQLGRLSFYVGEPDEIVWRSYINELDAAVNKLHTECKTLCKTIPDMKIDGFMKIWNVSISVLLFLVVVVFVVIWLF